jgi:hypothetical protein
MGTQRQQNEWQAIAIGVCHAHKGVALDEVRLLLRQRQQGYAVRARHAVVEEHDQAVRRGMQDVEGAGWVSGCDHRIPALIVQQHVEHVADVRVIINDQHSRRHVRAASGSGDMAARCTGERRAVEISRTVDILPLTV